MKQYAEVILPLALPQNYTYRIPPLLIESIVPGVRVIVQFGKRKLYTALVKEITDENPVGSQIKDILAVEDEKPIISPVQLKLWQWVATYYLCSMGELMMASLPAGLKLESETRVLQNQLKKVVDEELSDYEYLIVEALQQQNSLSIKEVSEITSIQNPLKLIHNLLGKHYILLEEEIKSGYRPKQIRYAKLSTAYDEKALNLLFEELERAPKQKEVLLAYFKLTTQKLFLKESGVKAANLLKAANANETSLKSLAEKGVFEIFYDRELTHPPESEVSPFKDLSPEQTKALKEIRQWHGEKDTVLLHGVTSSGKTEVYVKLIDQALQQGQQVLYLVPEIALTTQLLSRLKRYFGEKLLVYHSRFSDRERVETYLQLIEEKDQPKIIVGARSSLLLPFYNLGLIIVDEEHESSFKQFDPAPRYNARDAAIVLAKMFGTKVLLGSATPAFETYYNARQGKFGLVNLHKRYGDLPMPEIQCVDLKRAYRKREMNGHFSLELLNAIKESLDARKQVILFQNRRGFSPMIQCRSCGHVTQCKNCDISLTYHKHIDLLRCHYCGYTRQIPQKCPACGSRELNALGFGTEKLEDDLKLLLPQAEIRRMDLDTTRKKNAYENIISDFEEGEIDILVGTQMVTKGLDFENVSLVGIMNADTLLNFPDFRSHERAFQLMAQVAGRAGRKGLRGKVLIQTSDPYHNVIRKVMENDYTGMYEDERYERKNFQYPPFVRLIQLTLKHRDREHLIRSANLLSKKLKAVFGNRLLGPEFPLTARLRNLYHMEMMLKLEEKVNLGKAKQILTDTTADFFSQHPEHKVQLVFDVDCY